MSVPAGTMFPVFSRVRSTSAVQPGTIDGGIRAVVTGKGGVGKTTLVALLSHIFALRGYHVLAVDADPQQNLAITLGLSVADAKRIVPVSASAAYLREKTGAGPGISPGGLITLNPDVSDVVDRFSVPVAENLRLLVMGGVSRAGAGCLCPEYTLLAAILRHIRLLPDEIILLDTPAGMEHFGRAVAEGFNTAVVVTDTSYNALAVAEESAGLAYELGIPAVILAVNRVRDRLVPEQVRSMIKNGVAFTQTAFLALEPESALLEPSVVPLISRHSAFFFDVHALADCIAMPGIERAIHPE